MSVSSHIEARQGLYAALLSLPLAIGLSGLTLLTTGAMMM